MFGKQKKKNSKKFEFELELQIMKSNKICSQSLNR